MPGAFNADSAFISCFQQAALATVPPVHLELAQAIAQVGSSLADIKTELATANMSRVQGWNTDGFGAHVYRFVRNEMTAAASRDQQRNHRFYV